MDKHHVTVGTFAIERTYPASPARVFAAFARLEAKNVWADDPDYVSDGGDTVFEFREGGRESFGGIAPDGTPYRYDGRYYDIVPERRIVYSYEMYEASTRISVSLTTIELMPDGDGTRLRHTEQGAFLDGHDVADHREQGIAEQLDGLDAFLRAENGPVQ